MANVKNATDSIVLFRNSQGAEVRGTLMHLTRNLVVFEVYNPYSIVQLSEVLTDMRIRRGERTIYEGRAVVSNLVNTGIMLIVSATLVDPWSDLTDLSPGHRLREEAGKFVADWAQTNQTLDPRYQLAVSNISNFLEELSRWLEQGEAVARLNEPDADRDLVREFVADIETGVFQKLEDLFGAFEECACGLEDPQMISHKSFARREIHPLILCSPFIHRTYTKPLGYAGDYEMVNMMLRDRWEGANTYAKIVNSIVIKSDGAQAHRNRVNRLVKYLKAEAERVAAHGRALRVLNIGCGPAVEIQRFLRDSTLADRCDLTLLDFNDETLAYTQGRVDPILRERGRKTNVHFIHKSIHELLKETAGRQEEEAPMYDLVYCAGLFDYLSDRICRRLVKLFHTWTLPGGFLVVTNVHPKCPVRFFIEHLLEWNLVYRDEQQMQTLGEPDHWEQRVAAEATGVNLFLEIRKEGQTLS